MKGIKQFSQRFLDNVFRSLEAPRKSYEKTIINNMEHLYRNIRKGDVVLVEGNSEISRMIKLFTQSAWSHSAFYVGDELLKSNGYDKDPISKKLKNGDARHMIVEAFPGIGVIASPIRKYQDYNIRICRPYGILPHDLESVVSEIIGNLGKQYDPRNIVDLGLLLMPTLWNPFKKRTIQACLGKCSEFQVICSGMIAKAFQHVDYPIVPGLKPMPTNALKKQQNPYGASLVMRHFSQIVPKHFDISPNFQIIKFNIIESGEFNYKSLWK